MAAWNALVGFANRHGRAAVHVVVTGHLNTASGARIADLSARITKRCINSTAIDALITFADLSGWAAFLVVDAHHAHA